jgi:hypothetical protein
MRLSAVVCRVQVALMLVRGAWSSIGHLEGEHLEVWGTGQCCAAPGAAAAGEQGLDAAAPGQQQKGSSSSSLRGNRVHQDTFPVLSPADALCAGFLYVVHPPSASCMIYMYMTRPSPFPGHPYPVHMIGLLGGEVAVIVTFIAGEPTAQQVCLKVMRPRCSLRLSDTSTSVFDVTEICTSTLVALLSLCAPAVRLRA